MEYHSSNSRLGKFIKTSLLKITEYKENISFSKSLWKFKCLKHWEITRNSIFVLNCYFPIAVFLITELDRTFGLHGTAILYILQYSLLTSKKLALNFVMHSALSLSWGWGGKAGKHTSSQVLQGIAHASFYNLLNSAGEKKNHLWFTVIFWNPFCSYFSPLLHLKVKSVSDIV